MSTQQAIPTFEELREMFRETKLMIQETSEQMRETDRKIERVSQETDRKMQETDRKLKRVSKDIGALGSRIGEIIEHMVKRNIVGKFQALGYAVTKSSRHVEFGHKKLPYDERGEIDLFLEDGDVAILIEVKTTLETKDVRKHIERLEKYRRFTDKYSDGDKRRFIGAVAGAVVMGEAADFAAENGMYVIVQSGKAVEIVEPPKGFQAKEW